MVSVGLPRGVHQLHREIDAFRRRVGLLCCENIFLPEDRRASFDEEPGALVSVGHHAIAEDDAFTRLELDLECHASFRRE